MKSPTYKELLDSGVHFGHLKRKWNPKMQPYIFMERKGLHIIDLNKTLSSLEIACKAAKELAKQGKKILFVATKKQAKDFVATSARSVAMPYVTERWLGGMMTNFSTIKKSIKKMNQIDKMLTDTTASSITKKERLMLSREKAKLERVLGGIAGINRIPHAMFIIDIEHEHIALKEAHKLGVQTFAMVDTNADPNTVDFAIPANDDASKAITIITKAFTAAIQEGLDERRIEKDKQQQAAKV